MIIPSRNRIECIEDHTLEVTFVKVLLLIMIEYQTEHHTNIQRIRQKRNTFSGFIHIKSLGSCH